MRATPGFKNKMVRCAIINCSNTSKIVGAVNRGISFHWQGVYRAPGSALLLLLLLLAGPTSARRSLPAPQSTAPSVPTHPVNRTATFNAQLAQPSPDKMALEKNIKKDTAEKEKKPQTEGPMPPGAVLTRDLYVAGHSRPHPELCPAQGARLRLLILVSSAPPHEKAREAVRYTWGHAAQRTDVALGFVLGASHPQFRAALDQEDDIYGDLIEGRFVDSYSNQTLKTLSMLEWVDTYCPRASRLLKTDDNVFINVNKLLLFAEASWRQNATNTVWGNVVRRWPPKRLPQAKYFIPSIEFPGSVFPDFVKGAYLVTADAVRRLLRVAPTERYLRLEDVFVTGVLAARLGVRRVHAPVFYNKTKSEACIAQHSVAIHDVGYLEQFDLWSELNEGKDKNQCAGNNRPRDTPLNHNLHAEDSIEYIDKFLGSLG